MNDVILRNVTNRLFERIQMMIEIEIIDEYVTAGGGPHAVQRIHQRRLAGAGRAKQTNKLVRLDRQSDIIKQLDRPPPD